MAKILKNPPELDRLYAIRQKLAGTDRDDHMAELDERERKIKRALIALNLKGHEGITMLLERANEEIKSINLKLLEERKTDGTFSPEALINDSLERQRLLDLRMVWQWFKGFFSEAEDEMKANREFLDEQEKEEDETAWS